MKFDNCILLSVTPPTDPSDDVSYDYDYGVTSITDRLKIF